VKVVLDGLRAAGFKWPNMAKEVEEYVKSCPHCQKIQDRLTFVHGPEFHVSSTAPLEEIAMDTIGPLLADMNGNHYILVIVDSFSRWTELVPMKTTSGEETALAVLDFCTRYGTPKRIASDKGTQFANAVIKQLQDHLQTGTRLTTTANHQENGIAENRIKFVRRLLAAYQQKPPQYDVACMLIRRTINSRRHATLGMSPADIQFGIAHRLDRHLFPQELSNRTSGVSWAQQYWAIVLQQEEAVEEARGQLVAKHTRKARPVNPTRKFQEGDWILVEEEHAIKTGNFRKDPVFNITT
jgi:hypothetical protein